MPDPTLSDEVLADYDLGPDERRLLAEAERTLAELDRIAAAIAATDMLIAGSTGQLRANPLLAEARAHRETLAKIFARISLPDEEEETSPTLTQKLNSAKARTAANVRWAKGA